MLHGVDRMVVGFITTYAISAYHHQRCEFEPCLGEMYSIQCYVLKFVSDLATGQWFSPGSSVASTNKTNHHDMTEIALKVKHHSPNPSLKWEIVSAVVMHI